MIVHDEGGKPAGPQSRWWLKVKSRWQARRHVYRIMLGMVAVTLVLACFIASPTAIRQNARTLYRYYQSLGVQPERVVLDLPFKSFDQLQRQRALALDRNQITSDLKTYVKGSLQHEGVHYPIELRLKGQWPDHLQDKKWSFKIQLTQSQALFGMTRFSLQHPMTRNFAYEWIYHQALRREGVMGLRYRFVQVQVNGEDWGVYALEEGFEKRVIENNRRREGVLLGLDATHYYNPFQASLGKNRVFLDSGIGQENQSAVKLFRQSSVLKSPALTKQFKVAQGLLEGFRRGTRSVNEVFDTTLWARYFAVSELLGAVGAARDWRDIKIYYNPITAKLEPVGYEGFCHTITTLTGAHRAIATDPKTTNLKVTFHDRLFSDADFYRKYIQALERVVKPEYTVALLEALEPALENHLKVLYREWPNYSHRADQIFTNRAYLEQALAPATGVRAYLRHWESGVATLDVANIQFLPVEVVGVTIGDQRWPIAKKTILSPTEKDRLPSYHSIGVSGLPASLRKNTSMHVHYRILGASRERKQSVHPWPQDTVASLPSLLDKGRASLTSFAFLRIDSARKRIRIPRGVWQVTTPLIVPAGYTFHVSPGAQLRFAGQGKLISYSPVYFEGTASSPIAVVGSGKGQGLVVLQAEGRSRLTHTHFRTLATVTHGDWELTGAVTFYESPVDIVHSEFDQSRSEDALNLIRSEFSIQHSLFRGSDSDALDSDFSNGSIRSTTFLANHNDAIDVSGSRVSVERLRVKEAGDKAISVGEQSELFGKGIDISDSHIGVASKDKSKVTLEGVQLSRLQYGIVAYQKKPEFGPAEITLSQAKLTQVAEPTLIEKQSTATLNGAALSGTQTHVYQKLVNDEQRRSGAI